ncbi:MAG: type-F conjugative transfer system protein TraW [Candidatus Obscuribacterales bacterium]
MRHLLRLLTIPLLPCLGLVGADLGVRGHTYPIQEQDLGDAMRQRLAALTPDQQQQLASDLTDRYVTSAKQPKPVQGIGESTEHRAYTYDPTLTLKSDITDHEGNILFPAGTQVNPLDHTSLDETLLFFSGSDPNHIAWAQAQHAAPNLWVLISGAPMDLEAQEGRPVYFDQGGILCRKFGIRHVPAKVSQSGNQLLIEEIPVKPLSTPAFYGGDRK